MGAGLIPSNTTHQGQRSLSPREGRTFLCLLWAPLLCAQTPKCQALSPSAGAERRGHCGRKGLKHPIQFIPLSSPIPALPSRIRRKIPLEGRCWPWVPGQNSEQMFTPHTWPWPPLITHASPVHPQASLITLHTLWRCTGTTLWAQNIPQGSQTSPLPHSP